MGSRGGSGGWRVKAVNLVVLVGAGVGRVGEGWGEGFGKEAAVGSRAGGGWGIVGSRGGVAGGSHPHHWGCGGAGGAGDGVGGVGHTGVCGDGLGRVGGGVKWSSVQGARSCDGREGWGGVVRRRRLAKGVVGGRGGEEEYRMGYGGVMCVGEDKGEGVEQVVGGGGGGALMGMELGGGYFSGGSSGNGGEGQESFTL
ncbi:hypothetical protein Tco_0857739 [Tanacetum coccineum]|uniref:Uncharacterized protein n=1 Tax=Tanacetum coccineum TaxID=301880 RepID=A0ABQ5B9B6_9ASTR